MRFPYAFLEEDQHHHLSRVLRAKPGKMVWLVDENGVRYKARVEEVKQGMTKLIILERQEAEKRKIQLSLAQAVLKSKNMDWLIQKSTELGVSSIIPILAARSVVKVKDHENKVARWQRIAGEAAKQSRRFNVPLILRPHPFGSYVEGLMAEKKFIFLEKGGRLLREILEEGVPSSGRATLPSVIILVGPEGGWTSEEESLAVGRGFEPVSLGQQILRSETAALAAVSLVSHFWNT